MSWARAGISMFLFFLATPPTNFAQMTMRIPDIFSIRNYWEMSSWLLWQADQIRLGVVSLQSFGALRQILVHVITSMTWGYVHRFSTAPPTGKELWFIFSGLRIYLVNSVQLWKTNNVLKWLTHLMHPRPVILHCMQLLSNEKNARYNRTLLSPLKLNFTFKMNPDGSGVCEMYCLP